jgi:hypothetical protein
MTMSVKARGRILFACAYFLASVAACAGDILTSEELIKKAGIDASLKAFAKAIEEAPAQMKAQGAGLEQTFADAWHDAAKKAFSADKLEIMLAAKMRGAFSEDEQRSLSAYLESPLGKKITAIEVSAADNMTEDKMPSILQSYQKLKADGAKKDRVDLYIEIEKAVKAADATVTAMLNVSLAMESGLLASGKLPGPMDFDDLRSKFEASRSQLRGSVQDMVMAMMAYTYGPLTPADLRAYISFLKSPAGQKLYTVFIKSYGEVLGASAELFGRELAQGFRRTPA